MSGIALVANSQGFNVTGSDLVDSNVTKMLKDAGVDVKIGQLAENIQKGQNAPDVVVVSTAILDNNPEYKAAKDAGIEIWHRAQMLAYLGRNLKTLAVSGTHGKTSTSSMLASVIDGMGYDPSFLVGGVVQEYGTNAKSGAGEYYVVEADESDKSFRFLNPYSEIITNIEADHLDHYQDLNEIYEKFKNFMDTNSKEGYLVVSGDDKNLYELAKSSNKNVISYGISEECDCQILNYKIQDIGCSFDLRLPVFEFSDSKRASEIILNCKLKQNPGIHYAKNAASVIVLLDLLGFDVNKACEVLSNFAGIKRRFDLVGKVNDITVVDDYAHHSTEIATTIKSALQLKFENVHVIWQPHRYSRIGLFRDVYPSEFAHAFDGCASVTFTNIYAAGETPIPGVSGNTFLDIVKKESNIDSNKLFYVPDRVELVSHIKNLVKPNDLIITMGAGDITAMAPMILKELAK